VNNIHTLSWFVIHLIISYIVKLIFIEIYDFKYWDIIIIDSVEKSGIFNWNSTHSVFINRLSYYHIIIRSQDFVHFVPIIDSSRIKRPFTCIHFQILIFPEGTCTNRSCLITFKPGAFYPAVPVQPVLLRYPNKLDTVTWTWDGPGA
jgi:hypothetical protein